MLDRYRLLNTKGLTVAALKPSVHDTANLSDSAKLLSTKSISVPGGKPGDGPVFDAPTGKLGESA